MMARIFDHHLKAHPMKGSRDPCAGRHPPVSIYAYTNRLYGQRAYANTELIRMYSSLAVPSTATGGNLTALPIVTTPPLYLSFLYIPHLSTLGGSVQAQFPSEIPPAMASSTAVALRWAVLFLLALPLVSPAAVESSRVLNLCKLPRNAVPGRNCAAIRCIRYDPVCGVNGVTYGCGCVVANCYAVRVVKLGEC